MTKKLICPKCKEELEFVREYTEEYKTYEWRIYEKDKELNTFKEQYSDYKTRFMCFECEYVGETLKEFIVDGD